MRSLIYAILLPVLVCVAAGPTAARSSTRVWMSGLVQTAKVVVRGNVLVAGEKPVVAVERCLKGKCGSRLQILTRKGYEKASFALGEDVILFLDSAGDPKSAYLLYGDGGKYPWTIESGKHRVNDPYCRDFTANQLEKAIPRMWEALRGQGPNDKLRGTVTLLDSRDPLLNIVGLEEASEMPWNGLGGVDTDAKPWALWTLAALALKHAANTDYRVSAPALEVVCRGAASVTVPLLLDKLEDTDPDCRSRARSSLSRALASCGADTSRLQNRWSYIDPKPERVQFKAGCLDIWESVKANQLSKDQEVIGKRLTSGSALEKRCAKIYLDRLQSEKAN